MSFMHQSPLIHSSIGMKPEALQTLVQYIKQRTIFERQQLGWGENRAFSADSLFAKWLRYERQAEQDFKDRVVKGGLFEDSNLSQNLPYTIASQHHDRITRDLLESPKFFDVNPEGEEDAQLQKFIAAQQPPVVPAGDILPVAPPIPTETLMRVLHRESRIRNFHSKLAKCVQSALFRGHEIVRPCYERRVIPRRVQVQAWTVNGQIVRDSNNRMVMADQPWQADPNQAPDEAELVLLSDPRIRLPAGTILTKSTESYGINRMVTVSNGCDIHSVYWADFVIPVTAEWDNADFRGHFYRTSPDDIMTLYPQETWTREGQAYWKRHQDGDLRNQIVSQVSAKESVKERGEGDILANNDQAVYSNNSRYERTYFEWWGRYDIDGDGYAEPLHVSIDWDDETVIQLEGANIVLPWVDAANPHPYHNLRVFPVEKRWYGNSYYDIYGPWHEFGDKCWNRANLDMENSGNVFFTQKSAFVNPNDADELGFRTNIVYDLLSGTTANQALQVVSAASQAGTYLEAMDRTSQRIQAHGGTMGAADPQSSALPGAETLGGLNRILEQGDVFVSARERELIPTLNNLVREFADITIYAIRQDPSKTRAQVGDEAFMPLMEFLSQRPEHIRDLLEVNLSKAFGSGQVQTAQAIIQVLMQWMQVPSPYKTQFAPAFEMVLRGLGIVDPKSYLKDPEAAMVAQQQMMEQQQGAPQGQQPQPELPQ